MQNLLFDYSLTLPAEMPLIMYLEQKQNMIMIGTTEIATVTYVAPILLAISFTEPSEATITGKVHFFELFNRINGIK